MDDLLCSLSGFMCQRYFRRPWLSRMILVERATLTVNFVAADVSPRQNNSVKRFPNREICADLRRRLRLKDSTRHLTPTLSPNSVGGEGESSSVFHEIERSF
jgi:hypothetical protein